MNRNAIMYFLALFVAIGQGLSLNAQISIGTGTDETQALPIEPYYGYTYSQSIYLQPSINSAGNVTSLAWYFSGTSNLSNTQDIVVWMGHTSKTSFSSTTDWIDTSSMTRVYTGQLGTPTGAGWLTFTLDVPFSYNNIDNLVIAVDENTSSYNSSGDDFYNSSSSNVQSIWYRNDNTNPDPGVPPTATGTASYIPNITLGGLVAATPPNCDAVATSPANNDIDVLTTSSLNWSAATGSPTGYKIQIGTSSGASDFLSQTDIGLVTTYQPASPFAGGTNYYVTITPYNANGDATGCTEYSFTTKAAFVCPAGAVCATYTSGNISSDDTFSSLPGFSACFGELTLNIPGGNRIDSVSTFYDMSAVGSGYMSEQRSYLYSTNTNAGEPSLAVGSGSSTGTFSYSRNGLTFANGAVGAVKIQMHAGRTYAGTAGCNDLVNRVDDGTWTVIAYYGPIPACTEPTTLSTSNISPTGTDLAWVEQNSATQWQISYGATGFTAGNGTQLITSNNPHSLSGLSSSTTYDWYVRSICGSGDTSGWSAVNSFTTAFGCPAGAVCATYTSGNISSDDTFTSLPGFSACFGELTLVIPSGNRVDSISTFYDMSAVGGGWMSEQRSYLYSPNTSTGESSLAAGSGNATGTINYSRDGLSFANGAVDTLRVQMHAGRTYSGTSGCNDVVNRVDDGTWTVVAYYGPIPACADPAGLTADTVGSDLMTVSWTALGSEKQWNIEYDTSGFTQGTGTTVTVGSNPHTITGLSSATSYDVYIQAICNDGKNTTYSPWNGPLTVTTSIQGAVGVSCNTGNPNLTFSEEFDAVGNWTGDVASSSSNGDWVFHSGSTGSGNTGPSGAHSGSNYMYYEASNTTANQGAAISPAIDLTAGIDFAEMSFWLHAYGASIGQFSIGVSTSASGPFTNVFNWNGQIQTSSADAWINVGVNLDAYVGQTIYLEFKNIDAIGVGSGYDGDIAIDQLEITTCANCPQPSSLMASNATTSSIDVDWTENGSATNWQISYGLSGFTAGNGTQVIASSKPFNLSSLTSSTAYDFYVRAICGAGDTSGWSNAGSFGTAIAAPWYEDFESHTPTTNSSVSANGWSSNPTGTTSAFRWDIDGSGSTPSSTTGPSGANSGSNYAYTEATSGSLGAIAELTTASIDLSALTIPRLRFFYHMYGADMGTLSVDVYDGSTWTNGVFSITGQQQTNATDPWNEATVNLSSFSGAIQIRFTGTRGANYTSDMSIDDIYIEESPSCVKPTSISSSNATASTIDIDWVENLSATQWEISYGSTGFTAGNGTQVITSSKPHTLTGLTPFNDYDLYIRSICGSGDTSLWSDVYSFYFAGAPLSGIYTINSAMSTGGTNFQSFGDFTNALSAAGVSGAVTANVVSNSGPYTEQVLFGTIPGASASNTITINGNGETLQYSASSTDKRIVGLDGTKHLTIDSLTIVSTSTLYAYGVHLMNASDSNTIRRCTIDLSSITSTTTSNSAGILSSNSITSQTTDGNNANYLLIENNRIIGGTSGSPYYSVYLNGNGVSSTAVGNQILNNTFQDFYSTGVYLDDQEDILIEGNDFSRPNRSTVTTGYGINVSSGTTQNMIISKNEFHSFNGGDATPTSTGYYIYTSCDASLGNENLVVNNIIYDMNGTGTIYAIYNSSSDYIKYYHNSISLDDASATSGTTRGFYQTSTATGIEFMNNIISITRGGSGTKHGIYLNATASTISSDYNAIYVNSAGSGAQHYGYYSTNQSTFADWQLANSSAYDQNSFDTDPTFTGATDLTPLSPTIDGAGTNLGVLTDYFGASRTTSPDIGAIEFTPPSCSPVSNVAASNITASTADISWTNGGTEKSWNIEYGPAGYTQGAGILVTGVTNPHSLTGLNSNTDYDVYVQAVCGAGAANQAPFIMTSFTTSCSIYNAPYSENFDGTADPEIDRCWTVLNTTGSSLPWIRSENSSSDPQRSGVNSIEFYNSSSTSGDLILVSPQLDLDASKRVRFYYQDEGSTSYESDLIFGTLSDPSNAATFTPLDTILASQMTSSWNQFTYIFSSYVGSDKYIGIKHGMNTTYDYLFIDDFIYDVAPSCIEPTTLISSNVTNNSADLAWVENNSATQWQIEYGSTGFTQGTGTKMIVNNNPTNLNGLTGQTSYDWYVKSICGSGDSSVWSGPNTFTTLCDPVVLPYTENFENAGSIPNCMIQSTGNIEDWKFGSGSAATYGPTSGFGGSGYYAWLDDSESPHSDFSGIETPIIDLTGSTHPGLEFQLWSEDQEGLNSVFMLYIDVNNGSGYTVVDSFDVNNTSWELQRVYLGDYIGQLIQIRFRGEEMSSGYQKDIAIDNISVADGFVCEQPENLRANFISDTSASLRWNTIPNAVGYKIRWKEAGAPNFGPVHFRYTNTGKYDIDGLTSDTRYIFSITANCKAGYGYPSIEKFNTLAMPCMLPTNAKTKEVSQDQARAQWDTVPGARKYRVRYRAVGSMTWTVLAVSKTKKWLTGLSSSTTYEWQIKTVCEVGPSASGTTWSSVMTFTTQANASPSIRLKDVTAMNKVDFEIFPNPTNDNVTLNYSGFVNENVSVRINDFSGRMLKEFNLLNASQANQFKIELNDLSNGIYFIDIIDGDTKYVEKVIKN